MIEMPKLRKDLQNPRVQQEIRQSEEINRINSEIAKKLGERTEKQKLIEWNLPEEE